LAFIIAAVFSLSCLANTLHAQIATLTFTGQDAANQNVQLDMVIVTNVTRGWQELLFYSTIQMQWNDKTATLTIAARQGSYPGMLQSRRFTVVLPDGRQQTVNYDGSEQSVKLSK
jgi:hypothetical protein